MKIKHRYTLITIALLFIGCIIFLTTLGWNASILKSGDAWGYNAYLTGIFINGDLKTLDNTYEVKCTQYGIKPNPENIKNRIEEAPDAPNGNRVLKYYYGVAAMQAPFFLVTHLLFNGNGYTTPYVFAIYFSSIFYVLLGIVLLLNLLKNFVTEKIAAFSALFLFFGSNLFYFTVCNPGMAHPFLFFLFACLANCTYRFFKLPTHRLAAVLGFIGGLIVVTRAVEIIVLLVPILFGISGIKQLKSQVAFIRLHSGKFLLAFFLFLLVICPQLIYWKATSGQWLYDSYPNEGFDFLHPHILEGLFSFKNGWFSYTPLMIIPVLYLIPFLKRKNPFAPGIALYLLLDIYITYSWKQWNYNAGLGSRPMVETYALLLIPFSLSMKSLLERKIKWIVFLFLFFCVYLNMARSVQMQTGNFISEDATWQFNKQMLFKYKTSLNDVYAFDLNQPQPDTTTLQFVRQLGIQDFETTSESQKDSSNKFTGFVSGYFTKKNEFNDAMIDSLNNEFPSGNYIKVSAWARVSSFENHYRMGRIVVDIQRNGKTIEWNAVRINNKLTEVVENASLFGGAVNQWKQISYYVQINKQVLAGDILKVYGWNPLGTEFWIDNLIVDEYRRK